jgi:hypothetical protein
MGGAYGQRRLQDFFVRHLLGGEAKESRPGPRRDEYATRAVAEDRARAVRRPSQDEHPSLSLDLAELNGDRSELRGAIERYDADRGSVLRSAPAAGSAQRDDRIRDFTRQWLDRLGSVDFDRLSQDGKVDYLLWKNHLAHGLR